MFHVNDPRSEPRVLYEFTQHKMVEDAESDIAIRFVDVNDYREISACMELTVQQEILNTVNIFSGSFMIYSLKFEDSNFWFDIYSFISLLLFNKDNTWRPTCFIRPAIFLILLKH